MGLLDWIAKGWGQDSWDELTFNEKGFTIIILVELFIVSPFVILDILDYFGLI
tara:strand:- start:508 stop:666 length:159 start_codon:yes stop_codon:yes gene_type:complete